MKKNKFVLYFCFVLVVMIFHAPNVVAATNDFDIAQYKVTANVRENNKVDVTENFYIYFLKNVKYVKRVLDTRLPIIRSDKTKDTLMAKISNISSTDRAVKVTSGFNKKTILLNGVGTEGKISGYDLIYSYNLGKDDNKKFDEFYYYIVDGNWDTSIVGVSFEITLPKKFDEKNISFGINGNFKDTSDYVYYEIVDNKIVGYLNKVLNASDTFAIDVRLDEGYFAKASDNYNYFNFLLLLIPFVGIIFALVSWIHYGRGNKFKTKRQDSIPSDFDTAELAYIYKGFIDEADLVTTILILAKNGYLMFTEDNDGYKLEQANSFKIVKLKDYDKNNAVQKLIFDGLFKESDTVSLSDIEYKFSDRINMAKETLDNVDNKQKLFFSNVGLIKKAIVIISIVATLVLNYQSIYLFTGFYFLIPLISIILYLGIMITFNTKNNIFTKLIFGLVFLGIGLYIGIAPLLDELLTLKIYLLGMIFIIVTTGFYYRIPERTKYGNRMFHEIEGFKTYLSTITIKEMEEKLSINPNYFYELYPYAYVFELSDNWINKFSDLVKTKPTWYSSKDEFTLTNFNKFIKNSILSITQSMCKRKIMGMGSTVVQYKKSKNASDMQD